MNIDTNAPFLFLEGNEMLRELDRMAIDLGAPAVFSVLEARDSCEILGVLFRSGMDRENLQRAYRFSGKKAFAFWNMRVWLHGPKQAMPKFTEFDTPIGKAYLVSA